MISVGYVLMYFLRGQLPWQGLKAETNNEKYQLILDKKIATTTDELCSGFPGTYLLCHLLLLPPPQLLTTTTTTSTTTTTNTVYTYSLLLAAV